MTRQSLSVNFLSYTFYIFGPFVRKRSLEIFMKRKLRSKIVSPPSEAATGGALQKNLSLKI